MTGLKIKEFIEKRGLKQIYVAQKCGFDIKVFNSMLNGHRRIQIEELQRIAEALEVSPSEFLK